MEAMVAFQVIGAVAKGLSARSQGMADAARQEAEARLSETQGLQRDTQSRDELDRFLGTQRSARSANGLSATSPNALLLMQDANVVSNTDRQIVSANYSQQAANLRAGAKASRRGANLSLLTGVASAGASLAQANI